MNSAESELDARFAAMAKRFADDFFEVAADPRHLRSGNRETADTDRRGKHQAHPENGKSESLPHGQLQGAQQGKVVKARLETVDNKGAAVRYLLC